MKAKAEPKGKQDPKPDPGLVVNTAKEVPVVPMKVESTAAKTLKDKIKKAAKK